MESPDGYLKWFETETEEKKLYFDYQTYFFNKELIRLSVKKKDFRRSFSNFLSCRNKDIQSVFLPSLLFRYNLLKFPPEGVHFFEEKDKNWFYHPENWKDLISEITIRCFEDYSENPLPIQTVSPWRYMHLHLITCLNAYSDFDKELRVLDVGGGSAELGIRHTNSLLEYLKIKDYSSIRKLYGDCQDGFIPRKVGKSITIDLYPPHDALRYIAGNLFQNIGDVIQYYLKRSINPPKDFSPKENWDIPSETWTGDYTCLLPEQKALLKNKKINTIFASATFYQVSEKDQLLFKETALEILPEDGLMSVFCSNFMEIAEGFSPKMIKNMESLEKLKGLAKEKMAGVFFSLQKKAGNFFLMPNIFLSYFHSSGQNHYGILEYKNLDSFDEIFPFKL